MDPTFRRYDRGEIFLDCPFIFNTLILNMKTKIMIALIILGLGNWKKIIYAYRAELLFVFKV